MKTKTFETTVMQATFHRVQVEAESREQATENFQTDWDSFTLDNEIYERSSWDIDDYDKIFEVLD